MEATVNCCICGHTAVTLARHLKAAHGITADAYRAQYPGARVLSEACEANRKGAKKTICCPLCGEAREVGFTFAPATHDSRCDTCRTAAETAAIETRWARKAEGSDYVTCHGCGHRAENLTSHIQSVHPEWVGCYPGQIVASSSAVRDKTALRGKTLSEETKQKMSENAGRWNKGQTKETDPRLAMAAEHQKGRTAWSKGLTKETHPSLKEASKKLAIHYRGTKRPWDNGLKANLAEVDFTPYLDETGAVDRKMMAEELKISEHTITKYMEAIGLRLSTKYVDARIASDLATDRFRAMGLKAAEQTTIRLTPDQLEPFKMKNGKVVLARAMAGLGHVYAVIKRECDRLGLPTHSHLIKQTLCLEAVSKVVGEPYHREWQSMSFINPKTGYRFKFDGYFPSHRLIVEFSGYQHWTYPNVFHRTEEDFQASLMRDAEKEQQARDAGMVYLVLREDEKYTDPEHIRERWLDAIEDAGG